METPVKKEDDKKPKPLIIRSLAEREAVAARMKKLTETPEIGEMVPEQGIFLGRYKLKDKNGSSLGKVFNVFAAPEDLTDASGKKEVFKYTDAVNRVASLKNWNGFDGTPYATDTEIHSALHSGSYNGGWIIPPHELLAGTEPNGEGGVRKGKVIQPNNLFDHQNEGSLKNTFMTLSGNKSGYHHWYWSSTRHPENPSLTGFTNFRDGYKAWDREDIFYLSCRPVRLTLVSAAA